MSELAGRLAAALADRYRLDRELGQGGMATVYLAEDLRHHRKVALKVLRPELAATLGPDRFFREIEVAANLQHPHILPLHDSGEAQGFLYYVMPFIEGESLRARLARHGELPIHEAVKILTEVADALAYAHGRGVVHRDIKPDNILLSGRHALVTDFGVAKAVTEATGRQALTTAGVALGTPAYMAPEQAAADPHLDHRVDIYALGAMGYELLAGRPPFVGMSSQEILAAHVTRAPDPLTARRPAVPPALATIIMTCLAKRPADRWQSADELLDQLEQQLTPSGGVTPTQTRPVSAVSPRRPLPLRAIGIGATALLVALAALVWARRPRPALPALGKRSALTLDPGLEMGPAVSPDGKLVAYSQVSPSESRLVVHQVAGGEPVPIAKLPGAFVSLPAWSPDGSRLLYISARGLEVIPALGGVSRVVVPGRVGSLGWGSWAPDGERVVYTSGDSIYVRTLTEQAPRLIASAQEPHSPAWSPDGRWVAFVSGNAQYPPFVNIAPSSIWVVASSGGRPIRITEDQPLHASPVWLPDSRGLLFVSDQDGGRDIYMVRLSRAGAPDAPPVRLTTGLHPHTISLSADGRRLVYSIHTETANVKRLRLDMGRSVSLAGATPVTSGSQVIEGFTVSPDGKWVLFDSNRNGNQDIWRAPTDGSSPPEPIATSPADEFQPDYSGDGKWIAYHVTRSGSMRDLYVMPADGGTPERVNLPTVNNLAPKLSPDGKALVYNCGGQPVAGIGRACVTRREGPSWSRTTSSSLASGARFPDWSPDGRWIAFLQGDHLVRSTAEGKDARVIATLPAGLTAFYVRWPERQTIYFEGVTADGRQLVYAVPAEGGALREVAHSEGPTYQSYRFSFAVQGNVLYASLADPQSDVWMAEVTRP